MNEYYDVKSFPVLPAMQHLSVPVPGSKSITNRALLLAAMADGTSVLRGCMSSEDAKVFLECIHTLGFPISETPAAAELGLFSINKDITITGFGGKIPAKKAEIYVGSAGTAARFLVAMLALSDGEYVVRSSEQMQKRPMQPLIDALQDAGAMVVCMEEAGHFPMKIFGRELVRRTTGAPEEHSGEPIRFKVNIDQSSQFLSALLIAAGTLKEPAEIEVVGSHGLSYVDLTARMLENFGVSTEKEENDGKISYRLPGDQHYRAGTYDIEADMSAAAYFYALAAVLGIRVSVNGVRREMLQGDIAFLKVLEQMGCSISGGVFGQDLSVTGPEGGKLKGNLTVDMSAFSDQALTLAAIAPYADGPVTITGIGHIRLQECDRIRAIAENLTALGVTVEEQEDRVTISPGQMHGAEIQTYEDHRVAMAFSLCGLRTEGVRILNPGCCKKTFAEYFTILDYLLKKL